MSFGMQLLLGLVAGGTIFIGLLAGRWPARHPLLRSGLSMLAAGILIYLLVEILGEAAGQVATMWRQAAAGAATHSRAVGLSALLVGGFFLGLVGLVWAQQRITGWLTRRAAPIRAPALVGVGETAAGPGELPPGERARQLSWTIAAGIGLHNLSEGLAIGASAAAGHTALAAGLVIGFALHNATEGFAILGPLVGDQQRVGWRTLAGYGAVGGGPTFLGVLAGGAWTNAALDVFVLATAGGALLYVIGQILGSALRQPATQAAVMAFLAAGFGIGWGTEVVATVALGPSTGVPAAATCTGGTTEADGDVVGGTCTGTTSAAAAQPALDDAAAAVQTQRAAALLHEQPLAPAVDGSGVAHYTLTASAFPWQLYPGRVVTAWGYNGTVPGPLLRWHVGETVAVTLVNRLTQPTSLHWHGLAVPEADDGDPMTSAAASVAPGGSQTYTFPVTAQMVGTHWYHSHVNIDYQVDAGLHGVVLVDPAPGQASADTGAHADVDALVTTSAFKVDGSELENAFTIDGKAYPLAPALTVKQGQRVLLRLVNDSAEDTHVMHLHGHTWTVVARDGDPVAGGGQASNNINLAAGETADVLVVAEHPGTWMLQCHVLDHTINPGTGDGDAIHMADMGGLITYLTVTP